MEFGNTLFIKFLEFQSGGKAAWGSKTSEEKKAYARANWHFWVEVRQILGTCFSCNRKHQPGMQRCVVHRNKNKTKCLQWARGNRDTIRAEYKRRVTAKVCVNNPKHGAAYDGHIHCILCYTKRLQAKRNA